LRPKLPQPRVESEQVPAGRPLHFQEGISMQRSDAGGRLRPYTPHPSRRRRAFRGCDNVRWSRQSKTALLALRQILGSVHGQVKEPARFACRDQLNFKNSWLKKPGSLKCSGSKEVTLFCHFLRMRIEPSRLRFVLDEYDMSRLRIKSVHVASGI